MHFNFSSSSSMLPIGPKPIMFKSFTHAEGGVDHCAFCKFLENDIF